MAMTKKEQEAFNDLQRQRDEAVRLLHEWQDSVTQSPFSIGEIDCTQQPPRFSTRYVQTTRITCKHAGIEATMSIEDGCISIRYMDENGSIFTPVALVPRSAQAIELRQMKGEEQ